MSHEAGHIRRMTPLKAQRFVEVGARSVAPAAVAAAVAAGQLSGAGQVVLLFVAMLAASRLLDHDRYPMRLMPLSAFAVRAFVPVLGAGLSLVALAAFGDSTSVGAMIAPVVGAWAATAVGAWGKARFDAAFPVRIAIIGSPRIAVSLGGELHEAKVRGYQVVGWLADDQPVAYPGRGGPRRLGSLAEVGEVASRHSIDLLAHSNRPVAGDGGHPTRLDLFERVADDCLGMPVRLIEVGQLYEDLLGHVPLGQSNAAWFQYLLHPRYRATSPISKRTFDLLVAGAMLAILTPLLVVLAAAVRLTDGGPVFYRQRRIGEGGREFELIKLRSMRVDSEDNGPRWSKAADDRVTPVGKVMRRLHIDEMPQLWNILRGDMTLVGPRPERRELIATLERSLPWYDRRHLVKPGLAGWAQARCGYGGSEEGTAWKLCHDLYYLKHRSAYFDALVLLENVRVALSNHVQFDDHSRPSEVALSRPGELSEAGV